MSRKEEMDQLAMLQEAVEAQAANLDPAQREFVMSEFRTYRWNALKIFEIEDHVSTDEFDPDMEKKALGERHQLVNENASLFTHIMQWLKGTASTKSELEAFL